MPLNLPFDTTYLSLPEAFYTRQAPAPVADPALIVFNHSLAQDLGLDTSTMTEAQAAAVFSGTTLPQGATPFAQVYAGHQFGGFSPQLGDGRAIHLGELVTPQGRVDLQLKGAGRTPYSRMGDGRAWLGPVLREYIMSCAMQALDIPTTKALAAVTTGESVLREQGPLPGAIVTRVAASHIRIGTFQYFAARGDITSLQALTDYTINRHYPDINTPAELLENLMEKQAELVAKWLGVGFIHGVMNTDNITLSGETIDYGPCAFLDSYHPDTVFSFIDRQGRYAYSNQGPVMRWNLAQFASALVPIMPDQNKAIEDFTNIINRFPDLMDAKRNAVFAAKLGLPNTPATATLAQDLLELMALAKADFTNTFHDLDATQSTFPDWHASWRAAGPDDASWRAANPAVIPRTHMIEAAIQAATKGDYAPFHALLGATSNPFTPNPDYMAPPQDAEKVQHTFCGT